ncbi:hypothetical protein OBA47_01195 [bacterium]|nr:hypothetical protein [bacterium]
MTGMSSLNDHFDISAFDSVVVIFGGTRGLSKSLLDIYIKSNFFVIILSRNPSPKGIPEKCCKVIPLDIDRHESILSSIELLMTYFSNVVLSKIHVHILYGGSLSSSSNLDDSDLFKITRVFHHNAIMPLFITQYMLQQFTSSISSSSIHFCYYLSAVTQHHRASSEYVGAKMALESMLKTFVFKQIPNTYFSGFRLGIVPIDHKYLGKLRTEDMASFHSKVVNNVPSLYTPEPDEVADFIFQALVNSKITNGMICDISGGNSWI